MNTATRDDAARLTEGWSERPAARRLAWPPLRLATPARAKSAWADPAVGAGAVVAAQVVAGADVARASDHRPVVVDVALR